MKKYISLIVVLLAFSCRSARATAISNVTFSDTNITYETGGIPNGTTIGFTIDSAGLVQIAVNCGIQNFGDPGTNIANLSQTYVGAGTNQIFWNGLWLIGGDLARVDTSCEFALTLSSSAVATANPSTLVMLNSVDIHDVSVGSSIDASGATTAPFPISYALAKSANVTITVVNSSGTVVRTLINNISQAPEEVVSTHTITWDGLADNGQPASLGTYTVTLNATDASLTASHAITRTRTITLQSLAGTSSDPQKLFESNVYVYPNPVRNGQGIFNVVPVRPSATIHLRIYTIAGDLVLDKDITGQLPYTWNASNQSGNKLGRGLYYYVVREDDPQGTLQTVKKMAVLP